MSGGGSNPEYTYDADGKRIRKKLGTTLTEYVYNAAGQVVAERKSTNGGSSWSWDRGYVYLGSQLLAQYDKALGTQGATTYFAHKDHLGSTRLLTNYSGAVHQSYDYLPYGEPIIRRTLKRISAALRTA